MLRQAHTTNIYTKREHYSFYTFYTYNLSQSQVESPAKRIMPQNPKTPRHVYMKFLTYEI